MKIKKAIKILKSECYVFNPLNLDRTTLINTALDTVINELEHQHKVQDKLLNTLIEYGDEDMPCYKCNNEGCDYFHPGKECWLKWAEAEVEADKETKK